MTFFLTAFFYFLCLCIIGMIAFTALPAVRRFKRECWSDLPFIWRLALWVLELFGTLGDFAWNQTFAALEFGSFECLLLSDRVQKNVDKWTANPDPLARASAETRRWVRILNTGDPGPPRAHIRLPETWIW